MRCAVCGEVVMFIQGSATGEIGWCALHAPADMMEALDDAIRRDSGQHVLDLIKRSPHDSSANEELQQYLPQRIVGESQDNE